MTKTTTLLTALTLAGSADAASILFDFGGASTAGGNANTVAPGAFAPSDLSSPFTGGGVTLTASTGNTVANSRNRGANTGPASDITRDFIQWATGDAISITISGLVESQEYEFIVWSGDFSNNQIKTTDHTIAGFSGGGTVRHTSVTQAAENLATGTSLHQVTLPNVFTNASGELVYTIDFVSGGGAAATLSGMQLTLVPEPSSLALLALGGLLTARRRRG